MPLKVLQQGQDVYLIQAESATDTLPVGNYDLSFSDMKGFYLSKKDGFSLPEKIYGDPFAFAGRVLNTAGQLEKKNRGMGVLLSGKKGTGKSITAKVIAHTSNKPVISIASAFTGQGLTTFINNIQTPAVILLDEFEKTYATEDERNYLLSLLDGMACSRHLFVLTSNDPDIGEFFDSRPGRIRYHKQYDTLDNAIIEAIIDDKVADPTLNAAIKAAAQSFFDLSPDSLICIIEEALMYNEEPDKFLEFFNVRNAESTRFQALLLVKQWKQVQVRKGHPLHLERGTDLYYDVHNRIEELNDEDVVDPQIAEDMIGTDVFKYLEYAEDKYTSWYANPFRNEGYIKIDYMMADSMERKSFDLNWRRKDCDITRKGNEMTIIHKPTGNTLFLTVSAVKKHNAF